MLIYAKLTFFVNLKLVSFFFSYVYDGVLFKHI